MKRFPHAHATHPQWRMAAALVLAQLRAQMSLPGATATEPPLGLLYITDHYAEHSQAILDHFAAELPEVTDWAGTVGVGIAANNVEYLGEPALAVMLCDLAPHQYRVFSGVSPLPASGSDASGFVAHTALLHADPSTPDLGELVAELAQRTRSGYVFGGLSGSRSTQLQFAAGRDGARLRGQGLTRGVLQGGVSGVAFGPEVELISRVTQGAQPVGAERRITAIDGNLVLALDGEPALDLLLRELDISLARPEHSMGRLRSTLVGLTLPGQMPDGGPVPAARRGQFGPEVQVRHIIGLDPARRGVAIAEHPPVGTRLAFCERHAQAARADLVRVCSEIREELEPETLLLSTDSPRPEPHPEAAGARRIAGAIYVSCVGRGGPHFGAPSAELQIVRHALGDVPLVGFFASGEIAHQQLYGYTGVLTVFTMQED